MRRLLAASTAVSALLATLAVTSVHAQSPTPGYPAKSIRMVVTLAPGGGVDTTARVIGQRLSEIWGQQVVVENRPGAGGTIAAEIVARAAPDGHTLLVSSSSHAINPTLYKLSYDSIKDFAPISLTVMAPNIMVVHPSLPAKTIKELIALARARPTEILYASTGNGSFPHLAMALFHMLAKVEMAHVPYKGTAPGITDLIAGRVTVTVASVPSTIPQVKLGKLHALATVNSKRSVAVPELPTVAEAGLPGYACDNWYAIFATGGTPRETVARLSEEIGRVLAEPTTRQRLLTGGLEPVGMQHTDFANYYRAELGKWAKVVKDTGIRSE